MEILIERQHIHYLRQEVYQQVEVILLGDELRIYLHNQEQRTVFIMIEPAVAHEVAQIKKWLAPM